MKFPWSIEAKLVLVVGTLAAFIGTGIALTTQTVVEVVTPASGPAAPPRPSLAAQRVLETHLRWAEESSDFDPHVAAIREFLQASRLRTRGLAESVLSMESKWNLSRDFVTGGTAHDEFLQAKFEEYLFTEAEMQQLVEQAIASCLVQLRDIESEFLVRLEKDLATLPTGTLPQVVDIAALQATLERAIDDCNTAAHADLKALLGIQVVSLVAGDLLAIVGTQLATSAGLMGAGVSTGWATLGFGIVASIAADYAVTEIYHRTWDPIGKLQRLLDSHLESLETLILRGTDEEPGLEQRLQEYVSRRNAARRRAMQHAVLTPVGQ